MIKISNIEKRLGTASGTLLFTASTFFVKLIGGIYKIPLYNLLGNSGVGLYQIVFPVYALLLTISGGGIPAGMTKIIASGYNAKTVLKKCLSLFCPLGAIFSLLLFSLGNNIASLQGNYLAGALYKAISPSVFVVCLIGCIRGYFQGESNFRPSAFSQIIEQVVKAVSGVIALLLVKGDYQTKAFWACFAVTFSELFALFFLVVYYRVKSAKVQNNKTSEYKGAFDLSYKEILRVVLPLTLSSLCVPLASFLDTFIAVNALKITFGDQATAVFGVYTGGVDTIIALPVALLHSFTLGFLPKMQTQENFSKSLKYTLYISIFFTATIIIFAPLGVRILFGSENEYRSLLITLLRLASVNVILNSSLHCYFCS